MIKDDIEAGRYPVDAKGRTLVPTRGGAVATILATDKPGKYCIVGWLGELMQSWTEDGTTLTGISSDRDLLPPPPSIKDLIETGAYPRKDGYALVSSRDGRVMTVIATNRPNDYCLVGWAPNGRVLTWLADGRLSADMECEGDLVPPVKP